MTEIYPRLKPSHSKETPTTDQPRGYPGGGTQNSPETQKETENSPFQTGKEAKTWSIQYRNATQTENTTNP
ncbi:hypothetical protein GF326_12445 [Candidatus Bathyarchaeota archaeon]|nr:hypothetical protein [Candidatus Bathyarchaeota archaeon]